MNSGAKSVLVGVALGLVAYSIYRGSQGTPVDTADGQASPYLNALDDFLDVAYEIGGSGKMQISASGLEAIKGFEGFRANVYNDSAGFPTIGYGHKLTTAERVSGLKTITETDAFALLADDVKTAVSIVNGRVNVALTQNQFDALVSLCYNIGGGNFRKSTLSKLLNAGDYVGASNEFQKWKFAGGQPVLLSRRLAEAKTFNTGAYV